MLLFLSIITFIISGILLFITYKKTQQTKEINKNIDLENQKLEEKNIDLQRHSDSLSIKLQDIINQIRTQQIYYDNSKEILDRAAETYSQVLDYNYQEKEEEYDKLIVSLEENYNRIQDKMIAETRLIQQDLDKISLTRAAAIQAQLKEKEIEEDLSFYCLSPSEEELDDVRALERIKTKLHQPRILCMLIWSTYFQKPMTALCNNVLGTSIVTGIYKITNQKTKECYVGQAVDVAKRWKDHAKCGLGIDTPANNKLYKAIQEYGIWNFSWELIEKCSRELLNEKEAFYINLYQSKEYGYNTTKGNKNS